MTQGKHTPGHMRVNGKTLKGATFVGGTMHRISDGDEHWCGFIPAWDNDQSEAGEAIANAYRFCAAWNACEGIPTEALEAGVVKDMLEALHNMIELARPYMRDDVQLQAIQDARAAIAKATGEKP